jgi:carbamoyl-phosphate synthase large subunit
MNVAVTAVGGGVGQSIIKALQNTEYNVLGINSEVLGTGLYATRKSYLGHYAKDPIFVDRLIEICKKEDCKIVFPGLDIELDPLSNNREKLQKEGIIPVVSDPNVIATCGDKIKTYEFLKTNNFPCPKTYRLKDYGFELDFPVILKPQKGGHRAIGEYEANNKREFEMYTANVEADNYIVQERIGGEEYTCGTVALEKRCIGVILMKRELRNGDTHKAFVVKDEELAAFLEKVINTLKPFGACNIQLKMTDGIPYVFEINARCSGTTASRALAGFNEPKMICDYISKGVKKPSFEINEIAIFRYWKELPVSYDKIEKLKSKGHIQNKKIEL